MRLTTLTLLLLLLLGACRTEPPASSDASAQAPASRTGTLPAGKPGSLLARVDRKRLQSQLQAAPRPINIRRQCAFRDETGYHGNTLVEIVNSEVRALSTQVNVPDYGACNFDIAGFRQTQRSPSIELSSPGDGCTVRIWEQGAQLTISYTHCARRCASAETFKYVWPVLIDTAGHSCD